MANVHPSRQLFIYDETATCIAVEYEPDGNHVFMKTTDQSINVGDFVLIQTDTRHKLTVAKVKDVGITPDVESHTEIRWAYFKINKAAVDAILQDEAAKQAKIADAQRRAKRRQLAADLAAGDPELKEMMQVTDQSSDVIE
jgi:hypothetical protein